MRGHPQQQDRQQPREDTQPADHADLQQSADRPVTIAENDHSDGEGGQDHPQGRPVPGTRIDHLGALLVGLPPAEDVPDTAADEMRQGKPPTDHQTAHGMPNSAPRATGTDAA